MFGTLKCLFDIANNQERQCDMVDDDIENDFFDFLEHDVLFKVKDEICLLYNLSKEIEKTIHRS